MSQNVETADVERRHETAEILDDLVLVSNRQPYRHGYADDSGDDVSIDTPAGGLAIGIDPVMQRVDGTWIAWGDGEADFEIADDNGEVTVPPSDPSYTLQRIRLSEEQVRGYYDGYANQALWPLCHSATGRVKFQRDHWQQYRAVNEEFAKAIDDHVDADGTVWFQDYHFGLAPRMVREKNPDVFQMHFFHIPWPAPDVFRICPQGESLLDGLLGNDLLAFHCPRYSAQFLNCVDQLLDEAAVDWDNGTVAYRGRSTHVETMPFGVDADDIHSTAAESNGRFYIQFCARNDIDLETTVALGVDRLDYTKGIPQRLDALERLFEMRPDLQGEFTYVQKGCSTRERIPAYQRLRDSVEERIDSINERFGTDDWSPVVYTTEMYDRGDLFSLYRYSDMVVVGSLRDGMNLVAKEYVASQVDNDGVLLLSPFAGAHNQLGHEALEFDPYDTQAAAEAFERAVEIDEVERQERMRELRETVHETDLSWWLEDVAETAKEVKDARAGHGGTR